MLPKGPKAKRANVNVSVTELLRSPPLDQQVDLEGLGSIPGAGKLDSGFQLSVK